MQQRFMVYEVRRLIQLVKTDGVQGFQIGNQKTKQETSAWQQRSIAPSKLDIDFECR